MKFRNVMVGALCMAAFVIGIAGCGSTPNASDSSETKTLKVGVLAGPHAEFMDEVKKQAEKKGLHIELVEFSDFVSPDEALNSGELDATMSQHEPFLNTQIKNRGYKLSSIGKTLLFPMGVYSKKLKSADEISDNMKLAIPNDPSNGGRALEILEKAGLIKLKAGIGGKASVADIVDNPHHLQITEADAAMIPQMLPDLDFAVVNNSYAIRAGFVPTKDALIREGADSPYANVMAVRTEDKDKPEMKRLMESVQTPEMKQFVDEHFKGAALAAW